MKKLLTCLWLLLAASAYRAAAQITPTNPNGTAVNPAAPMVRPDTFTVRKPTRKQKREESAADSARRTETLFGFRMTKPTKAGLLAIVPGGGQIYNRKYWKLPIVYGLVGGLGYWVYYEQKYYGYFKYANSLAVIPATAIAPAVSVSQQIAGSSYRIPDDATRTTIANGAANYSTFIPNYLIFYRRLRDLSILLSAAGYSLTVLDAVVDAHLSEFDVSDDLSLRWQPAAVPVPGQAAFVPGVVLVLRARR